MFWIDLDWSQLGPYRRSLDKYFINALHLTTWATFKLGLNRWKAGNHFMPELAFLRLIFPGMHLALQHDNASSVSAGKNYYLNLSLLATPVLFLVGWRHESVCRTSFFVPDHLALKTAHCVMSFPLMGSANDNCGVVFFASETRFYSYFLNRLFFFLRTDIQI